MLTSDDKNKSLISSNFFWIVLFLLSFWLGSSLAGHNHQGKYIASDGEGYYMYLPAVFIFGTFEGIPVTTKYEYQPYPGTDKITTRFTYGVALMEAPFFAIAQLSRKIRGLDINQPFASEISTLLLVAGCFYTILGLFFVSKTLSIHFHNKKTVIWSLVILYLGTNLIYYAVREPAMSHAYSFFLIALLVYKLPSFWQDPSVKHSLLVGFLLALIVLIRPTNILFVMLITLYDVYSFQGLKDRFSWIFKNLKTLWLIPFIGIAMAIPQMIYWHYISGRWIINIYKEIHHASFSLWNKPELYKIFFDPCNGFLFYNPLMLFALIGMAWMAFKNQLNGRLIGGIFILVMYISASWSMWWFGHAFGYRPFIDYYPLMILGLAFYIDELLKSKAKGFKLFNLSLFIFLTVINFRFVIAPYYWQVEPDGKNIDDFWKVWNWVFDFSKWN